MLAGAGWYWMLRPASAWICKKIKNALSSGYQDLIGHLILTTSPWSILTWITLFCSLNSRALQNFSVIDWKIDRRSSCCCRLAYESIFLCKVEVLTFIVLIHWSDFTHSVLGFSLPCHKVSSAHIMLNKCLIKSYNNYIVNMNLNPWSYNNEKYFIKWYT